MRKWKTLGDLAALMIARSRRQKTVTVTSETAMVIGLHLMTADAKPTHDAVIRMICDSRCQRGCVPCTFKANAICNAYGLAIGKEPDGAAGGFCGMLFEAVKVYFGRPGQTQVVTSARKAGELLTHDRWPVQGTPAQEKAVAAVYMAMQGKGEPETVRSAFAAAVAEAGLLIED
jgi:hypothetical protein